MVALIWLLLQCIFSDGEPDHNHEKSICHTDCIDIASPQCVLSYLLPNYISEPGTSHNISIDMTSYQCVLYDDEPDSNSDKKVTMAALLWSFSSVNLHMTLI